MLVLTPVLAAFVSLQAAAPMTVPPAEEQLAAAVLAAPEEWRADATVLGYDPSGTLVTLRKGTNDLVCLADNPKDTRFSVACYHKDLEPFMARGRELLAQGVKGQARDEQRWKEIESGTLTMPREPRTLYVLSGSGFDAATRTVRDGASRWVIYTPYATSASTGLSTTPIAGGPWLMFPGTPGAHIMIVPAK
jgi:hypothetical protein